MSGAGIVVFTSHGVPALRAALRGIRDTVAGPLDLAVYASDCPEQAATYLVRQYLRGRISGFQLESGDRHSAHCGLDCAVHLVQGDYLVRVDDTLEFQPGWLERSVAALEADPDIGLLLPCNVVVREEADGGITVAFMDPEAVLKLVDKAEVTAIGREVRVLLQKVCASLKA